MSLTLDSTKVGNCVTGEKKKKKNITRGKRPGRERDVLVRRRKQTERRGSLGRGGRQINRTGSCSRSVWGKRALGMTLIPSRLPTALEAAAGRTGSIPCPEAKAQPSRSVRCRATSIAPGARRGAERRLRSEWEGRERAALPWPRRDGGARIKRCIPASAELPGHKAMESPGQHPTGSAEPLNM